VGFVITPAPLPGPIRLVITRTAVDNYNSRELVIQLQLLCPRIRALFVSDESVGELADNQYLACECAFIQASSGKSVGDGERQRAVAVRNRRNFLQVESKDLC
jgi:hypothetical protein